MRFSLNSDHKEFYSKNGFIEFEQLLSDEALTSLQTEIATVMASRPSSKPQKGIVDVGFDLWRDSTGFRKILFKPTLSEIAAQIFQEHVLRIAFDQYLDTGSGLKSWKGSMSLNDFSCAKPLAGALILKLGGDSDSLFPIPSRAGNGIFLSPNKVVVWDELFSQPNTQLLIIAYACKNSIYYLEKNDPHTHAWKNLGLVFGDRLNDTLHPIVYRS